MHCWYPECTCSHKIHKPIWLAKKYRTGRSAEFKKERYGDNDRFAHIQPLRQLNRQSMTSKRYHRNEEKKYRKMKAWRWKTSRCHVTRCHDKAERRFRDHRYIDVTIDITSNASVWSSELIEKKLALSRRELDLAEKVLAANDAMPGKKSTKLAQELAAKSRALAVDTCQAFSAIRKNVWRADNTRLQTRMWNRGTHRCARCCSTTGPLFSRRRWCQARDKALGDRGGLTWKTGCMSARKTDTFFEKYYHIVYPQCRYDRDGRPLRSNEVIGPRSSAHARPALFWIHPLLSRRVLPCTASLTEYFPTRPSAE